MSISVQNMRFLSSAVPEILRGPKIWKVGHATQATPTFDHFLHFCLVCPNINLRAKFQVSSFSRSRDIRGSRNLKSRSRDPGHAPFWPFFTLFCLVWPNIYLNAKFQVSSFSRSRDIRGSQKFWKVGHWPRQRPLLTIFTLFLSYDQTSIWLQNFKILALAVPEIIGGPKIRKVDHVTQATPLLSIFTFLFGMS